MTEKEYLETLERFYEVPDDSPEDKVLKTIIKKHNKELINEFPFLIPRNVWTDEIVKDFDYMSTELDFLPRGWRIVFGYDICKEIKEELIKEGYLNEYRITQIKEKYGTLRWYDNGHSDNVEKIINKYEDISENICIKCGEPAGCRHKRWVLYYCEDCVNKFENPKDFIKLNEE